MTSTVGGVYRGTQLLRVVAIHPATPDKGPYMYKNPVTGSEQIVCSPAHYARLMNEIAMLEATK